jgi:hypothetical protein
VDGVSRDASGEASEAAAKPPSVTADDDLYHLRRVAVEVDDLKIIDLAAVLAVAVNELVIEVPRAMSTSVIVLILGLRWSAASTGWPRPRWRG